MVSTRHQNAAILAAVAILVAACGGGGGEAGTPLTGTNNPPTAGTPSTPTTTPGTPTGGTATAPTFQTQPANASVLTDATASFTVTASGSDLVYQWKRNGADIAGATSTTYTTPPATYANHGDRYTVVVSNKGGSVTSNAAQLTLKLSANQQAFESTILSPQPGNFNLLWSLRLSGPQVKGSNFLISDFGQLALSPLTNGPQTYRQSDPTSLAANLTLLTPADTRVLKDGAVRVVPSTGGAQRASYVGSDVRMDILASDNTTVAYSTIRSEYQAVALTGALGSAPDEFKHFYNAVFDNPGVLDSTATFAAGAGYLKYTQKAAGDRYDVFDCRGITAGPVVSSCVDGSTLADVLSAGFTSNSDGRTYHLADGEIRTVGGVPIWVASSPRPQSSTLSATVQYRIYFELGGNVYTGSMIKDGTLLGAGSWVSNPAGATLVDQLTFLTYQVRLNQAARDSLKAAVKI